MHARRLFALHGLLAGVAPFVFVNDVRLEVVIAPTKRTWQPRETIKGMIRWKNVSPEALTIYSHSVFDVEIADANGVTLPRFGAKMYLCGNFNRRAEITVQPGETTETRFSIATDPMGMIGGFRVTEGERQLVFRPVSNPNIKIQAVSARIEIRRAPEQDLSPRIVKFALGGNRIIAVRANGRVDVFDLDSEEPVATIEMKDYAPRPQWESVEIFSPNGLWMATAHHRRGKYVELHRLLHDAPPPIVVQMPGDIDSYDSWRLVRFRSDSRKLYLTSEWNVYEIDCETGKISASTEISRWASVSPDGRFFVAMPYRDEPLRIYASNDLATPLTVKSRGEDRPWDFFLGNRGIFVRWKHDEDTVLLDFNGETTRSFPSTAGGARMESSDGRLVVFCSDALSLGYGSDKLAVWSTEPPKLIWKLSNDKHRTPRFTQDSKRLVCGDRGESVGVPVLRNAFEVFEAGTGRFMKIMTLPAPQP